MGLPNRVCGPRPRGETDGEVVCLEDLLYILLPGVSKGCFLEAFKYLRASKKHGTFETPGIVYY